MKRYQSFDCISSAFVWTIAEASSLSRSQSYHLHCSTPLSLSPKEILSYSFAPSETCDFPLLFVSEAPQSRVPASLSGLLFSNSPLVLYTPATVHYSPLPVTPVSFHTFLNLRMQTVLIAASFLPCLADFCLSFRTRLRYLVCETHPSQNGSLLPLCSWMILCLQVTHNIYYLVL